MGIIMAVPAIVQPAFLTDIIKIDQAFAGSINGLLQNMSQIATLLFVALIGVLSDKVGRKILAFAGFIVAAVLFLSYEPVKRHRRRIKYPSGHCIAHLRAAETSFPAVRQSLMPFPRAC